MSYVFDLCKNATKILVVNSISLNIILDQRGPKNTHIFSHKFSSLAGQYDDSKCKIRYHYFKKDYILRFQAHLVLLI